jgi:hypothetical protein
MGKIKIPYYTVIAGRGYWRPTPKMRLLGFQIVRCGTDGPEAWALAAEWNTMAGRPEGQCAGARGPLAT